MHPLKKLSCAVRDISPYASIKFTGIPDPVTGNGDLWHGSISVGDVIITEHTGEIEETIFKMTLSIGNLSSRILHKLANITPPDPFPAVVLNENGQDLDDPDRKDP